jgi:hypothetical protein
MMDLIGEFFYQVGLRYNSNIVDPYLRMYIIDETGFNYVDGEEGDYGVVKYFLHRPNDPIEEAALIAVRYINGGDDTETRFTVVGKRLYAEIAKKELLRRFRHEIQEVDMKAHDVESPHQLPGYQFKPRFLAH